MHKRVLIVGLFPNDNNSPITQAAELARVLSENNYDVLTVSKQHNKYRRLLDIMYTMLVMRNRYDVAVVQFYSGNSFIWQYIAGHLAKILGKKLVFTVHGGGVPARIKKYPKRYLSLLQKADVLTCPSAFIEKALDRYMLRSITIENTIPLHKYSFVKKDAFRPAILWMRAFSDIYNPLMAVRAVAALKKDNYEVKMYMGGPDLGMLADTVQLINELQLQDNIIITGFLNFDEKQRLSQTCDIYISTNKIDNSPVTFVEMWAMGLPVISTNIGGVADMVNDGIDGLLVNDDDHIAMAARIKEIISNAELGRTLAINGRKRANAYDESVVFDKWDTLLNSL